jgi:hypothetical protein
MLNKSPAYRESNPVAAGGPAAGGTGIVSAVRVAGLQQYEHLGLNVEFPLRIRDFACDYYKESLSQEIADKTVPAMKVRSETGKIVVKLSVPQLLVAGTNQGERVYNVPCQMQSRRPRNQWNTPVNFFMVASRSQTTKKTFW